MVIIKQEVIINWERIKEKILHCFCFQWEQCVMCIVYAGYMATFTLKRFYNRETTDALNNEMQ